MKRDFLGYEIEPVTKQESIRLKILIGIHLIAMAALIYVGVKFG